MCVRVRVLHVLHVFMPCCLPLCWVRINLSLVPRARLVWCLYNICFFCISSSSVRSNPRAWLRDLRNVDTHTEETLKRERELASRTHAQTKSPTHKHRSHWPYCRLLADGRRVLVEKYLCVWRTRASAREMVRRPNRHQQSRQHTVTAHNITISTRRISRCVIENIVRYLMHTYTRSIPSYLDHTIVNNMCTHLHTFVCNFFVFYGTYF